MNLVRDVPAVAVVIILTGTLVSGPLAPGIDFTLNRTEASGIDSLGSGSVNVSGATLPDSATIERGSYGSGSYYLQVPDATVRIESYTGRPILAYRLDIDSLGYSRQTIRVLVNETDSVFSLELERDTLDRNQLVDPGNDTPLTGMTFPARLTVLSRADGNRTIIARRNITVEVVG